MKRKNKIIIFSLIGVALIHLILFSYFIDKTPLFQDASFHENIIEGAIENQGLIGSVPFAKGAYGYPRYIENYPVAYPQIYYVFGTIIYQIFPEKTVYYIDLILTLSLILVSFILARKITNNNTQSIIFSSFIGLISGFSYSPGNNNFILLLAGTLSIYSIYSFLKDKNLQQLILFTIFSVFLLGTKQLSYFLLVGISLSGMIYLLAQKDYKNLKKLFFSLMIVLVLFLPILGYQIYTTGTISTPAVNGWPIIDDYILKPQYLQIEEWQTEIDDIVNISYLDKISATRYYEVNKKFNWLLTSPISLFNQYFNPASVTLLPATLKDSISIEILFIIFFFGLIFLVRKNNRLTKVIMTAIFISGLLVILFSSRVEYFLFLPFFGLFISSFFFSESKISKTIKILILSLFIILFLFYSHIEIEKTSKFGEDTYMRGKIPGGHQSLINLTNWLNENVKENELVLAGNTQDIPYYSKRNIFWDYRLFFLNETQLKYYLPNYPNFKYIVITNNQITSEFTNWVNVHENSKLLNLLKNEQGFKKVYDQNSIRVYKITTQNQSSQ